MGLFDKLRAIVRTRNLDPPEAPRLSGGSVDALAVSLEALPVGKRGWITLREASRLFSRVDDHEEAFGELDGEGRKRLREFAAEHPHRSDFAYMPVEGRLYFTRNSVETPVQDQPVREAGTTTKNSL